MTEEWRPVKRAGYLEVSSEGRVRNARTGKLRKLSDDGRGYLSVSIGKSGRARVHRLVAAAFIGEDDRLVRHLDGDPTNNRADNLAYGTVSENQLDSVDHGTHANSLRTHCSNGHEFTEGNVYRYTTKNGSVHRKCRKCDLAQKMRKYYRDRGIEQNSEGSEV